MMTAQEPKPADDAPAEAARPNYTEIAETLETLGHEAAARAQREGNRALAQQCANLLQRAATIRSDLAKTK